MRREDLQRKGCSAHETTTPMATAMGKESKPSTAERFSSTFEYVTERYIGGKTSAALHRKVHPPYSLPSWTSPSTRKRMDVPVFSPLEEGLVRNRLLSTAPVL
jgi:hypothetical protein